MRKVGRTGGIGRIAYLSHQPLPTASPVSVLTLSGIAIAILSALSTFVITLLSYYYLAFSFSQSVTRISLLRGRCVRKAATRSFFDCGRVLDLVCSWACKEIVGAVEGNKEEVGRYIESAGWEGAEETICTTRIEIDIQISIHLHIRSPRHR